MTETSQAVLRRLLLDNYNDLIRRLTSRLGSRDLAQDALQETFLRVERTTEIGELKNPYTYLIRIALNIATDRRRVERRRLTTSEVDVLLTLPDQTPGPAQTAEARSEIEMLERALGEMPERRRQIFLAAWVEGAPRRDIAARFGISIRTLTLELKAAREYCAQRLDRKLQEDCPTMPPESSLD